MPAEAQDPSNPEDPFSEESIDRKVEMQKLFESIEGNMRETGGYEPTKQIEDVAPDYFLSIFKHRAFIEAAIDELEPEYIKGGRRKVTDADKARLFEAYLMITSQIVEMTEPVESGNIEE